MIIDKKDVSIINNIDWNRSQAAEWNYFGKILETNKVLVLAEPDHGYERSFAAKTCIIKHLIDSSLIKVLYIESSWINCARIVEELNNFGEKAIESSKRYANTADLLYWMDCGFWDYLCRKIIEGRIQLKGFDINAISPLIVKELYEEAIELPDLKVFRSSSDFGDVKWFFENYKGWVGYSELSESMYRKLASFINEVLNTYSKKADKKHFSEWQGMMDMIYWYISRSRVTRNNKISNLPNSTKQESEFHKVRDSLMAEYFFKMYDSTQQSVCWVSAYHALRNSGTIKEISECCKEYNTKTMFELLSEKGLQQVYSICFIAGSGTYGVNYRSNSNIHKVKTPEKNSIEKNLMKLKIENCFIDFQKSLNHERFTMNAVFYRYLESLWVNNYSGIFYIRKMRPLVVGANDNFKIE